MSLAIFIITSILIILSIIIKPKIWKFDTYILIALLGAITMLIFREISAHEIYLALFKNKDISPLKILVLFITMTFLSITCDSLGLFNFLAYKVVGKCKGGQISLFTILYIMISILTIFTSNDIIILTFTPFIIFLCKRSNINPIPYLVSEFAAANTASMMLLVGNPTNIVLSLANRITFIEYLKNMWLISLLTIIFLYLLLILIFIKELKKPMEISLDDTVKIHKLPTIVALIHLSLSTILLAISNYINIEMYLITLVLSISLLIFMILYIIITKKESNALYISLRRLPISLIPFLLSMFVMVEAINVNGYTLKLYNFLSKTNEVYSYGLLSFGLCNLMNNIPMSVLISNTLINGASTKAIYASVIGSNIGAYLTPLGALAGIMWLSILRAYNIKFGFKNFIKYGVILSIPTILFSITILYLL